MANPTHRIEENAPGPWYVDDQCIACGLCAEYAPTVFRLTPDSSQAYVHHQPLTPADLTAAEESRQACPVDAIGNDYMIPAPLSPLITEAQRS